MDNYPTNHTLDTSPLNSELAKNTPVKSLEKNRLLIPLLLIFFISAIVFGYGGYYIGKQSAVVQFEANESSLEVLPTSIQTDQTTPAPSTISEDIPSSTPKSSKKLSYSLPTNWKTLADSQGRLEVGYDSTKYDASAKDNQIDLSGKWEGTQGTDLKRLGWNRNIYLAPYNGGSRHVELYKILGVTSSSADWKSPNYYSEKEYLYNGWNCLIINGVDISQYPVAWGYCPTTNNEALVFALDSYDWSEIEQQIMAVRLLK